MNTLNQINAQQCKVKATPSVFYGNHASFSSQKWEKLAITETVSKYFVTSDGRLKAEETVDQSARRNFATKQRAQEQAVFMVSGEGFIVIIRLNVRRLDN